MDAPNPPEKRKLRHEVSKQVRADLKVQKLKNSKQIGRAKSLFRERQHVDEVARARKRKEREEKTKRRMLITFFALDHRGRKTSRKRFPATPQGFADMMALYDSLPMARQLRAAHIAPVLTGEASVLAVDVTTNDHVMLIMMLGKGIEVREERKVQRATYDPGRVSLLAA